MFLYGKQHIRQQTTIDIKNLILNFTILRENVNFFLLRSLYSERKKKFSNENNFGKIQFLVVTVIIMIFFDRKVKIDLFNLLSKM